jgi:hypothetical protein
MGNTFFWLVNLALCTQLFSYEKHETVKQRLQYRYVSLNFVNNNPQPFSNYYALVSDFSRLSKQDGHG